MNIVFINNKFGFLRDLLHKFWFPLGRLFQCGCVYIVTEVGRERYTLLAIFQIRCLKAEQIWCTVKLYFVVKCRRCSVANRMILDDNLDRLDVHMNYRDDDRV